LSVARCVRGEEGGVTPRTAAGRDYDDDWPGPFTASEHRHRILAIEAEAAPAPGLDVREVLLTAIEDHAFLDYPTPRCDCEEWPAKDDHDKYWNDHLATVLAARLAASEAAEGEGT
jgi:hypothetical protein